MMTPGADIDRVATMCQALCTDHLNQPQLCKALGGSSLYK